MLSKCLFDFRSIICTFQLHTRILLNIASSATAGECYYFLVVFIVVAEIARQRTINKHLSGVFLKSSHGGRMIFFSWVRNESTFSVHGYETNATPQSHLALSCVGGDEEGTAHDRKKPFRWLPRWLVGGATQLWRMVPGPGYPFWTRILTETVPMALDLLGD